MTQQTFDMLADMRLSAMATELANQLKDPSFAALGFEERLDMIVTADLLIKVKLPNKKNSLTNRCP